MQRQRFDDSTSSKSLVADIGLSLEHADRQHQKARRAEAALQAMMIHEGALHRMQLVAVREPLDGADLLAVGLHGKHQAGAHRLAVDDHGAGAADAVLAADMGAGLPAILADRIGQRAPRLDRDRVLAAVDGERDRCFSASCALLLRHASAARIRCGVAGISSIDTPNGDSASLMALITAAGAPMAPPSPRPLALVIECLAQASRGDAARSPEFRARSAAGSRRAWR